MNRYFIAVLDEIEEEILKIGGLDTKTRFEIVDRIKFVDDKHKNRIQNKEEQNE